MTTSTVKEAAQRLLAGSDVVIFDSETTDLRGRFVQLGILALDGTVLLDTLVNPLCAISRDATGIHGITAEQVADAPTFAQIEPQLRELLHDKDVVVYNVGFDRAILEAELVRFYQTHGAEGSAGGTGYRQALQWIQQCRWHCAMELYSEHVGEYSYRHGNYRWQRLPGGDHSAIGDARATLAVLKEMATEAQGAKRGDNDNET